MRRWWHLPEGWLSPILILALVITAGSSLQGAAWHEALRQALDMLIPAALGGFALGFLLAWIRRIPRLLAHVGGLLVGGAWIVHLSGALRAVVGPLGESISFLDPALQGWQDLATELLIRVLIFWRTLVRGASGEDIVLFVILLALISWLMGFLSAWFAIRSHWPAMTVGFPGLVLLLNTFYAPRVPPGYFGFYLFLSLLFLVYYFWKQREAEWQAHRVRYPPEISWGVFWAGAVLSVLIVLGTSFLPTTAGGAGDSGFWERFIQPWREVRTTWERLFSNVSGDYDPKLRLSEFGPRFGLSGARIAPEGIAFVVRSTRSEYLRALTFDQYTGRGWNSASELGPVWVMGADRLPVSRDGRTTVVQEITPYLQGGNLIFAYAEPVSASLPAVVELSTDLYGADESPDIVAVRTRSSLAEGVPYTVISYVSVIDKTSLRQSGQSYPSPIASRYLQLPDLPPRVYELADRIVAQKLAATLALPASGELTLPPTRAGGPTVVVRVENDQVVAVSPQGGLVRAGLVTPYDAAEAIEEYLRTQYTYREDISAPPSNADAVDYFLFVSKAGYCDYFASAMAVLLRTQGVPIRLVRGYAGGYYDQGIAAYVIPAQVAHSWVEVYFPNYGWQRFEPTAADYTARPRRAETPPSRPTPLRDLPNPDDDPDEPSRPHDEDVETILPDSTVNSPRRTPWAALGLPASLVALGGLAVAALTLRVNRGLRDLGPAAAAYERMCRWADVVRLTPPDEQTPYEISAHLGGALAEQRTQIAHITSAYVRERFGRRLLSTAEASSMGQAWKEIRWPLWSFPLRQLWAGVRRMWTRLHEGVRKILREPDIP